MGRLSKEVKILSKNLPCSKGGSIFVVMDDDYMTSFRALLSGPIDTPYCYGLYEFSIELPQDFPNSPPVVLIETTGNN